jgi:type II secretory pathway predicted ATPase ExeA
MAPVASVERSSMATMSMGMVWARRERRVVSMLAASLRAGTMTVMLGVVGSGTGSLGVL